MLVERARRNRVFVLSALSAALAAGSTMYTLANVGIYDGVLEPGLLLGTLGFDVMSMVVALALFVVLRHLRAGDERFWLLWLGLQGYLLYAYAIYAFGLVYTELYFAYIAIAGLSAYALAGFALHFNRHALRQWHAGAMPRRTMGAVLIGIAALFGLGWTGMLARAIGMDVEVAGAVVLVLDLAFALPLLVVVGVLLERRRPLGDFLAPAAFGMSAAITLGVAIGEFLSPLFGQPFDAWIAAPYLLPGAICLTFSVLAFKRIGPAITQAKS